MHSKYRLYGEKMTCCKELKKALQPGTDNEGYDPLIYTINEKYIMGYKLAPINYCPWCGTNLTSLSCMVKK
jgi:hypothetical protein